MSKNILATICEDKYAEIIKRKAAVSVDSLTAMISEQNPALSFKGALDGRVAQKKVALITEIKKASPSRGIIRPDFDPVAIACTYESAGAACLSVLTDEKYFQGCDDYLRSVKSVSSLPVLRKDFMLDPYQIYESRAMGADCILLIMAALSDAQASELEEVAIGLGMDVLVEVHNAVELERALKLKSRLIGINNRDLISLEIDLAVTQRLLHTIPAHDYTVVSESGISCSSDIKQLSEQGVYAFLVGTSLMGEPDIAAAVKQLLV